MNRVKGGDVTIEGLSQYVANKDEYATSAELKGTELTINRHLGEAIKVDLSQLTSGLSGTDYQLVANPTNGSGGKYTVDDNGNLTLTVKDLNNPNAATKTITITGLAKKTDVAVVHGKYREGEANNLVDTNAQIWDEAIGVEKSSSIALGNGAFVSVQNGRKADAILFGSDTYTGGIAIGENSKALNATVNIGVKDYKGKMGDVDLSDYKTYEAMGVGETSIGSNSYISGSLSTNIGSYNITTTKYGNTSGFLGSLYSAQNFGSVIVGTLNSIESNSSSAGMTSGVANSVIGMANKTQNSNGSLVFGTGNEITNSTASIPSPSSVSGDVADVAENFRDSVSDRNKSNGGAVLAIGGGNKADYAQNSQLIGVQNEITGTSRDISKFNMINGYQNTITNGSNDTVIGTKNTVTNGDSNVVLGDNHAVQAANNNVIVGSSDEETTHMASDTVVIGHNAQANGNNDVAIGSGSIANGAVGTEGYAGSNPIGTVSVGSEGSERTITNVAAGRINEDSTDAVNGSQLYATNQKVDAGWVATDGTNKIEVNPTDSGTTTLNFAGDNNITVTADTTNKAIQVALNDKVYLGGDHTEDSRNIVLDGERGVIGLGSNIALDGRDGTAVIGGVNIDTAYDEATGKPSSTITGLSNTTWDGETDDVSRAATEGQLKSVWDKANTAASSHTEVTVNGGTPAGNAPDYSDGNLQLSQKVDAETGKTTYDVKLNDNITLGNKESSSINLDGNDGSIALTNSKGETAVTINKDGIVVNNSRGNNGNGADVVSYDYDGDHGYMGRKVGINSLNEIGYNTQDVSYNYTKGKTTIGNVTITRVNDPTNAANANKVILNTAGNNLVIRASGSVETKDDVIAKGMVQAGDVTVNADDSGLVEGLTNTTWTPEIADQVKADKADGTADGAATIAATQGQLGDVVSDLSDQITNSGWTASTNNGAVTTDITNGDKVDFANTDGNIAVNQTAVKDDKGNITGTNLTFDLNPDITLDDDVEDGNSVQLSGTNGTINAHNSELIFGGTGKYDNVNDMTFNQNGLTITNTQTMRDTGETTTSSTVINGGSIATGNITAGGITVNADNGGTVNGLTNKTWDADNYVSGQAATEDQLKSVSDKVNAGWIATDSQNNEVNITPDNNKLNFAGDENVTVTAANNEIKVALNDDITLKGDSSSIELTGTKGTIQVNQETAEGTNFTNINGNVVSIGYTNSEGIENAIVIDGGKGTITGLSNTTWDDELAKQVANSEELQGTAATQGQLQQAVSEVAEVANAGWNAKAGGNTINVKPNETLNFEGDGNITVSATGGTSNELKFGLNDNITLGDKAGQKTSTSLTLYTDPTLKEVTRIGEDGNPETVKVTGYIPESYIDDQERIDNFISTHGGFMMYATNTSGEGVFGITTDGMVHAKDVISYMPNSDSTSKDKILKYSLNDIGDIVTQIAHAQYDKTGMEYTLISDFSSQADKDKPFQPEEGERTIGLAVREDGAVVVGAVVNEDGYINDSGIRINAEKRVNKDGTTSSDNMATITGLENTTWTPPEPEQSQIATFADDTPKTSRAATESQLDDLYSAVAAYDVNVDGTIDYSHIALAGAPYGASRAGNGTPTGGTSITNVAYASGNDGSEAVNVDYLNNAIKDAVKDGPVASNEKHLDTSKTYTPDKTTGTITINEVDGTGAVTGNQLVINDVASKAELDSLKTNVGDLNYDKVTGDKLVNGDSVTTAIGKLDNKIDNISGTATNADNNTVTGGTIKDDGTISLTQKDGDTVALDGKLTDSGVVQDGTKFDGETGTLTITSQDKYNKGTSSVTVSGIASKDDIGTVKDTIGATSKEDLKDAYKDADKDGNATTEYITDSESMVEADVALDHAIQDVAGTSYANDMVLSNRIDSVEKRLGNVEERIDKVGAMAAAIANLRTMGFDPEAPTEIAIGVGQYKSETGIAIGVFHYPNQDFMLSASLSSSGDELMGGIGATWKLGRKSAAERAKDEEARHLEQAEEMKKLAQQEKVKAQAQRHAKLLAERQQASQKNA